MKSSIRIMLVDDHTVLRHGLGVYLQSDPNCSVIAEAENGRDALKMAKEHLPDIVLMDIGMPELNGIESTRRLRKIDPAIKVIALSMYSDARYIKGLFDAGGKGYLLKTCDSQEVKTAIMAVHRGKTYISPEIAHVMVPTFLDHMTERAIGSPSPDVLTGKEYEILQLIAEGMANKEIATTLTLSVKTIETHRAHLMRKLGLHNVAGLTKYAIRHGMTYA